MPAPAKKYRPYFTLQELREMQHLIEIHCDSDVTVALHKYLATFIAQVEFGIRQSAHTTKGKMNAVESLGFVSETNDQYRYENDLMTPEEEVKYEKQMGVGLG